MSKTLAIFVKGIFMLIIGIYLSSKGLPSDQVGVTVYAGNHIIDAMNQTAKTPEVSKIAQDTKQGLLILGIGATIIGILEIVLAGIALFRGQ